MPKNFFRENLFFILGWLLVTIVLAVFLLSNNKTASFILLNPWHHLLLDYFFRFMTFLGDGIFVIPLGVLLFFLKKRRLALLVLSSYLISGFGVQLLKYFIDAPRPFLFLQGSGYNNFPKGITLHTVNSFPSGHTASAFALAASVSFFSIQKKYSWLLLLGACLTGYSRIYLAQHFPEDVITGAALGVFSAIICILLFGNLFRRMANFKIS